MRYITVSNVAVPLSDISHLHRKKRRAMNGYGEIETQAS